MRRIATALVAAATAVGLLLSGGLVVAAAALGSLTDSPPRQQPRVDGGSSFRFLTEQEGSSHPVIWDGCTLIHFVVRPDGEPRHGRQLIVAALAEVQALTGLEFVDDGATDEAPSNQRPRRQPERYGDRWAPVLFAWSTPKEYRRLQGTTVGRAHVSWTEVEGHRRYVTGQVILDGPQLSAMLDRAGGRRLAQAVILHELGHLVGLDHVGDPGELMSPDSNATEFGPGDLAGLRRLASVPCQSGADTVRTNRNA